MHLSIRGDVVSLSRVIRSKKDVGLYPKKSFTQPKAGCLMAYSMDRAKRFCLFFFLEYTITSFFFFHLAFFFFSQNI